ICRSRPLAEIHLRPAGGNCPPVNGHRIEYTCVRSEMVDYVVAPLREVRAPLLENSRSELARGYVRWRVPVGVERDVADKGVHHRRLGNRIWPTRDNAHR